MLNASISGSGQLRQRTINVEANLLTEWLMHRQNAVNLNRLYLLVSSAAFLLSAMALPTLIKTLGQAGGQLAVADARLGGIRAQVSAANQTAEGLKPQMDEKTLLDSLKVRSDAFFGHTLFVMNSAGSGINFARLKAEVSGGELVVRTIASAQSYGGVQAFVDAIGQGPGLPASFLVNTKRAPGLGPEAVTFEHLAKVELGL